MPDVAAHAIAGYHIPALKGLLLGDINALVPLAQLAQLRGPLLGCLGCPSFMPHALVL